MKFTALADAPESSEPIEEEYYSSWSLALVCILLIISLWTSYYLQIKRIRAVHETLVAIFAGMFVGLVVRLAPGHMIRDFLTFKHTLFFNLLLPPIILNSGYELKQSNFFTNFGSIIVFAFMGTFISAVGLGLLVFIYSYLGLESLSITPVECLMLGATLSATDPVTILSIFNQYKVDPKLYTVIFGESLLNDAVSIVMYETLVQFHGEEISLYSLFHGTGIFLLSFSSSMALGVAFGLAMSLTLKHSSLALYPHIETCLVALVAYTSYFLSNGLQMSGIVSLLFCGITLKHYAYHTMSTRTQRATKYIFSTLAQLSENFIFVYLGLSLFTSPPSSERVTSYFKPIFIVVTTISVIATRYIAVFPLAELINFFHRHVRGQQHDELPHSYQMMLFWAGLRGAVGVALAAGFTGNNAYTLRITVLVVVLVTVLLFGGTTARMLEILGIRVGVDDEDGSSDEETNGLLANGRLFDNRRRRSLPNGGRYTDRGEHVPYNHHTQNSAAGLSQNLFSAASSESDSDAGEALPMARTSTAGRANGSPLSPGTPSGDDNKWFQAIDERYLLPLFSNATASRTFHARRAERRSASNSQHATPQESEDEGTEIDLRNGASSARPLGLARTNSKSGTSR